MNGLKRRPTPTFELVGVAITPTMALAIQLQTATDSNPDISNYGYLRFSSNFNNKVIRRV